MPSDAGLRLEDFHYVQHLGSQVIEPRKHQAIDIGDGYPLGRPTPQHIELMPKGENVGLQGCARPEQPGHCVPDQLEEIGTQIRIRSRPAFGSVRRSHGLRRKTPAPLKRAPRKLVCSCCLQHSAVARIRHRRI